MALGLRTGRALTLVLLACLAVPVGSAPVLERDTCAPFDDEGSCKPCFGLLAHHPGLERRACGDHCPRPARDLCEHPPAVCSARAPEVGAVDVVLTPACRHGFKVCLDDPQAVPNTHDVCEAAEFVVCDTIGGFACSILERCTPVPRYVCRATSAALGPYYVCYPPSPPILCEGNG